MYSQHFASIDQTELRRMVEGVGEQDVRIALEKEHLGIKDFAALISSSADPYLEQIANKARQLTIQRFGRTILMYAPLYVSNYCTNGCLYCGFNHDNQVDRLLLTPEQVMQDAHIIASEGFRHLLLVSGEDRRYADTPYLCQIARQLKGQFSSIGVEVQPLEEAEYAQLNTCGVDSLTIYQETYDRELYAHVHPKGRKHDFNYRIDTPDRGARGGMRKVGLGVLLGLGNWAMDACNLALHVQYMMKTYWRTQVSVSFPRLRVAAGGFQPSDPVSDKHLFKLICAFRLFTQDGVLVLSTRESAQFRDLVFPYGVTQMSAGSKTNPGGYTDHDASEEQFHVEDPRSAGEVARAIKEHGYEAVWKDWDVQLV
ncbi:thiazole biosynthesis protein ThiH [Desulfurispirillum indicum S5]|uniref:Thiazole biosynthesis protein ThiH n=1 Tax=Desulfurispirillum indicum (strain ATCC BAA-1389 / DSM 22839 / S5) TaxID=653733 RepID=E6W783_DESIS|nr:2-iminoacetate synthase ThiH [Desulfurispirillum indicum]ADU66250.1 thiazole biosynthesis protein ThiH [Desulfurispirillum indicum S5]